MSEQQQTKPQLQQDEGTMTMDIEQPQDEQQSETAIVMTKPPRQWAIDRCNGASKIGGNSRPPFSMCYAPPCVKWWPSFFEQNIVCESSGRLGLVNPENQKARTWLMGIGMTSNIIGLILTILSCLAISSEFDVVRYFSYSAGRVTNADGLIQDILISVGLRSISFENNNDFGPAASMFGLQSVNAVGQVSIDFDDVCSLVDNGLERYMDPANCSNCADVSSSLVSTLITTCIAYIFMIAANTQRMWPNYDVNCQKTVATFLTFISFALSMATWRGYMNLCFVSFFDGDQAYNANGTVVPLDSPDAEIVVTFDWTGGAGLFLIILATFLKLVDATCHFLLPTPSITRNREEQDEYETIEA